MVINWPFFVVGILLLWFPRQWMRLGKSVLRRRRKGPRTEEPWLSREPGDPRLSFRHEFRKARNYFDLLRATAGGLAIVGWREIPAAFAAAEPVTARMVWIVIATKLAILCIGLLIQVIRTDHNRITLFAAVFFIAGLAVSLCEPWAALFAFLLIWAVNPMLGSAQAFLTVNAVLMTAFGIFLGTRGHTLPVAAGLFCFLPALLSWMVRRPLVVFSRKGFHPGETT